MEENKIKSFTFFWDYYYLIDTLPIEDKKNLSVAILDYVFKDEMPNQLTGHNLAIFNTLSHQLDNSKAMSINGKKGGAPKGNSNAKKQPKNNLKTNEETSQKQTNNISTFYFLISNFNYLKDKGLLREKIEEWLKYKWERKEYYKETGMKTLLARIERATSQYGVEKICDLIDYCMSNNYKGIIFEKLEKTTGLKQNKPTPEWLDKKIEKEEASEKEMKELEEMMKNFK